MLNVLCLRFCTVFSFFSFLLSVFVTNNVVLHDAPIEVKFDVKEHAIGSLSQAKSSADRQKGGMGASNLKFFEFFIFQWDSVRRPWRLRQSTFLPITSLDIDWISAGRAIE